MKWYAKTMHALLIGVVLMGVTLNCSSKPKQNDASSASTEAVASSPENKAATGDIPPGAKALM